ncbi:MAG: hypothetical protein K5930_04855 [Treponemataceae bacterium]|nr:hypothetical protein [Treponemataceae bacterium]
MKKLIALLLVLVIAVSAVSAASDFEIEAYGGIGIEFSNASGFKNVRVSDYARYGSAEGSVLMPLAGANGIGALFTVNIGAKYELLPSIYVLGEACIGFAGSGTSSVQIDLGAIYVLPFELFPKFHLGAGAKIGFLTYTKGLGKTQVMEGTTPPVILSGGSINTGDELSFSSLGIDITPIVDATYQITNELAVGIDMGCQISIFLSDSIQGKRGDTTYTIPSDPKYFYESNDDYPPTLTTFKPEVSMTGFKANLHVLYKF